MDEEYDAIVLGTGLKECIISGLLSSVEHLKVQSLSETCILSLYDHKRSPDKYAGRSIFDSHR